MLHSDITQKAEIYEKFINGEITCIVATNLNSNINNFPENNLVI